MRDLRDQFFQLKGKWNEKGERLEGSSSVKRKMFFGGNIKSFQSVKFRFTFTHVYTCTSKLRD